MSENRTSVPDRLKELALLKDGWHDGQGLAITPEIIEWTGAILAELPSDLPGWRRGCQPLRDGRWTWLLTLPVRSPPPPGAPLSAEWATHTPMENA